MSHAPFSVGGTPRQVFGLRQKSRVAGQISFLLPSYSDERFPNHKAPKCQIPKQVGELYIKNPVVACGLRGLKHILLRLALESKP